MTYDYLTFKLVTGEDILAKILKDAETYIDTEDPFVIQMRWSQNGELQMGLLPFMPYSRNNKVTFERTAIVSSTGPADELIREYTKHTSGILIP